MNDECVQLISDHFITGSSGVHAANSLFHSRVSLTLIKLKQTNDHFSTDISADSTTASETLSCFNMLSKHAACLYDKLGEAVLRAMSHLSNVAVDLVVAALKELVRLAAGEHAKAVQGGADPSDSTRKGSEGVSKLSSALTVWPLS